MNHAELTETQKRRAFEMRTLMFVIWKAQHQSLEQWLAEHEVEITRLQLGVLRILQHDEQQTMSDISRKIGVDPSTLVPIINTLENKGWVERKRDPADRRRMPLFLTEKGHEVLSQVPWVSLRDQAIQGLVNMDDADVEELVRLLWKLLDHIPDNEDLIKIVQSQLRVFEDKETDHICKHHDE